MTDTIDRFAAEGLGLPATGNDIRNRYNPSHGNGVLPDDRDHDVVEERQAVLAGVDPDEGLVQPLDTEADLRRRIAYLEEQNYGQATEIEMYRRFFGSKDDEDQRLFMQSIIFLAATALEFKFDTDKIEAAIGATGICMHPEESIRDTGFGVFICDACHKAVEPEVEPPCQHSNTIEYGTVGLLQCLDCQTNLPREHFTRLDQETTALADNVGVSIPKGQPTLNPGLAPRLLPSGE